jgi:hypothetical protein
LAGTEGSPAEKAGFELSVPQKKDPSNRSDGDSGFRFRERDRGFESISLQRRVWYEPDIHALEGGATETFRSNGPNSPLFSAVNSASSRRQHDGSIQFICMDWRHRGAADCWPLRLWRAEDRLVSCAIIANAHAFFRRDASLPCRLTPGTALGRPLRRVSMRKSTRIAVVAFLSVVFVTLVLTAPISALAQNSSTEATGQQPDNHSHQHTHQGNKRGASGAQP